MERHSSNQISELELTVVMPTAICLFWIKDKVCEQNVTQVGLVFKQNQPARLLYQLSSMSSHFSPALNRRLGLWYKYLSSRAPHHSWFCSINHSRIQEGYLLISTRAILFWPFTCLFTQNELGDIIHLFCGHNLAQISWKIMKFMNDLWITWWMMRKLQQTGPNGWVIRS